MPELRELLEHASSATAERRRSSSPAARSRARPPDRDLAPRVESGGRSASSASSRTAASTASAARTAEPSHSPHKGPPGRLAELCPANRTRRNHVSDTTTTATRIRGRVSVEPGPTTAATRVRGRVRVEPGTKRIRAYLGGELVADTTQPLLVWEKPVLPHLLLPGHRRPYRAALSRTAASPIRRAEGTAARSP